MAEKCHFFTFFTGYLAFGLKILASKARFWLFLPVFGSPAESSLAAHSCGTMLIWGGGGQSNILNIFLETAQIKRQQNLGRHFPQLSQQQSTSLKLFMQIFTKRANHCLELMALLEGPGEEGIEVEFGVCLGGKQ